MRFLFKIQKNKTRSDDNSHSVVRYFHDYLDSNYLKEMDRAALGKALAPVQRETPDFLG